MLRTSKILFFKLGLDNIEDSGLRRFLRWGLILSLTISTNNLIIK